jgi:hypothetical protein
MKIGFSGTYSTGKSKLIEALSQRFLMQGLDFGITRVSTVARRCPFPLNKAQTMETSLWILSQAISEELVCQADHTITVADRTVIDVWALSRWALKNQQGDMRHEKLISLITSSWIRTYDIIFRTRVERSIEPNWPKIPDRDLQFRNLVEYLQGECIETLKIDVVELPHDEGERLSTILERTGLNRAKLL